KYFFMKKILFLACSLAVIVACSIDNENRLNENTNENTTEKIASKTYNDSDIDDMFYEYVNSEEFIVCRTAVLEFNQKLGTLQLSNSFDTEEEFYLWINENITETNFVNMDEVYTKWNHIKLLVSM